MSGEIVISGCSVVSPEIIKKYYRNLYFRKNKMDDKFRINTDE